MPLPAGLLNHESSTGTLHALRGRDPGIAEAPSGGLMAKKIRIEAIYRSKLDARRVILALREVAEQDPTQAKPLSRERPQKDPEDAQPPSADTTEASDND